MSISDRIRAAQSGPPVTEAGVRAATARALDAIAAGRCHICGAPSEPRKKVGRCVYGACGHRIGQVGR